jgi:hypothetical protein
MIFRHVREHVAHHNWFAVAIDLAIVVIGVFLGTQANNWNQARLEGEQAREYRAMLIGDLDANLADMAMRKRYYQWVRSEGLATLAALKRPPASSESDSFSTPIRRARSNHGRLNATLTIRSFR